MKYACLFASLYLWFLNESKRVYNAYMYNNYWTNQDKIL